MKRLLIIAGIVVGIIIVAILVVPLFINVDSFRPEVEKKLSDALGRQVTIGRISASLLSGGAEADNISISDDPAFNKGPFLQASSLQIGLQLMPLIFSHQLKIDSLTIKKPDILLLKSATGKWNYSSLGNSASGSKSSSNTKQDPKQASPPKSDSDSSAPADFSVSKFQIQDGKIRVAQVGARGIGKEHAYQNVNLLAQNISTHSLIPFVLSGTTPGGGSLEVQGQAGPLDAADSAKTPFNGKINLEHADLAASGLFDPSSGLGGIVDFDGTVKSDGHHLVSNGKGKASNLRLVKAGSPARQPVTLDYDSDSSLDSQVTNLKASVHTGNSVATTHGTLSARGEETLAHLAVEGNNMAVNDIEGLLPAFGMNLPSGASLQGGTINTTLNAEGPLDNLVITGPVKISQTHLTGFNLSSKLAVIAAFTGIKPSNDTLIQTLSSALRVAPDGVHADNILLDVPSIGQLTGAGIIGSNQALDFKMLLKLVNGGGMLGQLTNISSSAQSKGIPFLIQGTSSDPVFKPTLGGVASGLLGSLQGGSQSQQQGGQQQGIGGLLNNLLNKKKKQQ
jgi:AsmA protein